MRSPRIRRYFIFLLCVLLPFAARANPVMLDPASLIAFGMVAFWAFVIEAGIVTLLLIGRGISPLRLFGTYFITNILIFFLIFQPLLGHEWTSIPALELLIVVIDASVIWFLARITPLQGDSFSGVSWWYAAITSGFGNAASYLVGYIASRQPWIQH